MGAMALERTISDLVFVGFNRRVAALDRYTGELVWSWKSPHSGALSLLVDGDRLIVSVNGYTWCLHPLVGDIVWHNELSGFGVGIPCLASVNGNSAGQSTVQAHHQAGQRAAAATVVVT